MTLTEAFSAFAAALVNRNDEAAIVATQADVVAAIQALAPLPPAAPAAPAAYEVPLL